MQIPVYVINLTKDIERWSRIETSLLALGISPIRIRAVDGPHKHQLIRRLIRHDFAMKDRPLTPGEIGCALSHIGVWKRVHRRGLAAVVLEDDAELFNSFKSFYFRELSLFLQRCDIVKFEGLFFPRTSLSGPMLFKAQSTRLIIPFQPTMGSAGYALTRRGAEVLLRCTTHITMPIDFLLRDYPGHGAVYGETRPMLAKQGNFVSNIEAERHVTGKVSNKRSLWRGIRRSLAMIRIVLVAKVLRPMLTR